MICQRNCWIAAAAGGVLLAVLLAALAGYHVATAAFLGILFFALFGTFLTRAFCTGKGAGPARPEPAAERGPAAQPDRRPAAAASGSPHAPEPAPAAIAEANRAPDPGPAPAPAAAKAPRKTAAKTAKPPAARKAAAPKPAARPPRAAGLDAAMGKTKDEAAGSATPLLLMQPRDGKGDDLQLIKGVGPALEQLLNEVGVWHFDQIAAWKARDIAFVDGRMEGFRGRITRDEWVKQARVLAKGGKV